MDRKVANPRRFMTAILMAGDGLVIASACKLDYFLDSDLKIVSPPEHTACSPVSHAPVGRIFRGASMIFLILTLRSVDHTIRFENVYGRSIN